MKSSLLLILTIFSGFTSSAQSNDTWTAFWNADTTLFGYKDKNGVVKIEPKFNGFSNAGRFDHIIAAMEENDGKWTSYYLTKSGKTVGRDSLHIFDNYPDCESEGFIRFRDKKTGLAGMFDRNGKVVIPAEYNELTRVRNGMVMALKGAEKKYWDKYKHEGCEHFSWVNGKSILIDTTNKVLIENFPYNDALNYFTLQKTVTPHSDTTRISFPATDGTYYSFINHHKEFEQWLRKDLLNDLTNQKLIGASYDTITWETEEGWKKTSSKKLIANNFQILKSGLLEILQPKTDYFVSNDGLNPFMYGGTEFEKYFTNCGESKDWIYPTMSIIVSHEDKKGFSQNHYEFLRTDAGYKLISLTVRNKKLK